MSKGYEDLSRRGLIRLNHDFDEEYDGALHQYLAEHGDEYENIRPVENVINRVDQIVDTVSMSTRGIRQAFKEKNCKDMVVCALDVVVDNADVIKSGINAVSALVTK